MELLDDHTVVKVKINTTKLGTLEEVAKMLMDRCTSDGAVELIHVRESENTVMLGKDGALGMILDGSYPPPVVEYVPGAGKVSEEKE